MKTSRRFTRLGQQPPNKGKRRWRIVLLILAVLLLGVGILFKLRWHAWFGNVPEAPYSTEQAISRVTLTPGEDFISQRTITWLAGEQARPAELLLRPIGKQGDTLRPISFTPTTEVIASRSGRGCYYQVHLDSLNAGGSYLYTIRVQGADPVMGRFAIPDTARATHFVYMGDVQDPSISESKHYFDYLRRSVSPIDFFAFAGDQIEGPTDAYWRAWYASIGDLTRSIPIIAAPGNHEYLKKGFGRELDPRWVRQFGYPTNGPQDFLGRSYFIDMPLLRFIIMDTTDIMGLGAIKQHKAWLRDVLKGSHQPWQIVLFHHAVDCVREGRKNLVMHYLFKDELVEGGADLVLQGHDHGYGRSSTRSESGDTIAPVFVISSASPKVYRNGFDTVHDRLGSGMQLYQRISVDYTSIHYASYRFPEAIAGHPDSIGPESKRLYDSIVIEKSQGMIRVRDLARDLPERFDFAGFGSDSKGRKKAAQYAKEVRDRKAAHSSQSSPAK